MREIDAGFIGYEMLHATKRASITEALESVHYLTEIRDEHERLNDSYGVAHYESAINAHLEYIKKVTS